MKNEKSIIYFTIMIICVILTCTISMRFKAVEKKDFNTEQVLVESELRTEIANYKEKYNEAEEEIENVRLKIQEYESQIEKNEYNLDTVNRELKENGTLLGRTNVKGDGVIVILSDNDTEKIIESDISELINELKYAGAEAISINDIRLEALIDVSKSNENIIILNGQKLTSPYEVKAIRKSK